MEAGQNDGRQTCLVPVGNAVEEDLAAVLPLQSVVDRVRLRVREIRKQVVALDPFLVRHLKEQVREVLVERGNGA